MFVAELSSLSGHFLRNHQPMSAEVDTHLQMNGILNLEEKIDDFLKMNGSMIAQIINVNIAPYMKYDKKKDN